MSFPSTSTLYPGTSTFPGTQDNDGTEVEEPRRIQWNLVEDRQIEAGVDRGVLYLNDGITVPWNGLLSVDEEGGEGAAEYYVDGRPFLFLPKPKEFKANISAFTYPDAFSSVLGEVEVADGMYLDSQQGDSFGLSYRTKIYSAAEGENAGYKIHLVYNATIVPSPKSYQTIGAEVNPVEFSWDIQGVPVLVEGYRPTAHIMIDTRHMEQAQLDELEDIIYGTASIIPSMPDPQAIFDLLKFSGAIIITDNGNGTWTAEGSYQNIYMIGDEIFQIDNVNAVDHGDGTYTISSTPQKGAAMATVDGITAAEAQRIEDASVVSGVINILTGHLILTTAGGIDIDAGQVTDPAALAAHIADTSTHGITSELVGRTEAQTLTNKALTDPAIASFINAQHTHNGSAGGGPLYVGKADSPAPVTTLNSVNMADGDSPKVLGTLSCPAGRWLILASIEGCTLGATTLTRWNFNLNSSQPTIIGKPVIASSNIVENNGGRTIWGWLENVATASVTLMINKLGTGALITTSAQGAMVAIRMG